MSRSCVVQKYGGSSVADVTRIRAVAARIVATRRRGFDVVVVVSAMGNTTNELLALAEQISPSPGRRELDLLISVGERVSMTLLAMAIQELGEPAQSFTGSQSGIITDTRHVNAAVEEVRPHRIQRALDEGQIVIVAGFQGVSRTGEVTTLGRGGSDTTAVVLTAALGAEYCEICSDVDGVYTADPRTVDSATKIDELPLDSAIDMAQAGSKVLLAEALHQAKTHGVTLSASATAKPSGSGTRVIPTEPSSGVVAIAADIGLCMLEPGAALKEFDGSIRGRLPDGRVLVDERNLPPITTWSAPGRPIATVSAVGREAVANPAVFERAVDAVTAVDPSAQWWSHGQTLAFMVARSHAAEAERALHDALLVNGY